jgi:dihydroorotase
MRLLIRSATIIDASSPFHQQTRDLFVENGILTRIAGAGSIAAGDADQVITSGNLHVSAGWLDMRVSAQDPGYEHREDLYSVREAAASGGFTEIAVLPNAKPPVQTKQAVTYLKTKGSEHAVRIHPMAAVSIDIAGKDLTEMIDLHTAGAVAFTDGHKPVWHSDIFVKTLQYLQTFNGVLINRPEDQLLTQFGNMHEGLASTRLGLKGMPALAEEMMIARDLRFLEYAGGKLHFTAISTATAVNLIREAKRRGLAVTCDMAAHQIAFTDEDLAGFDTNLKVNPPFRRREDIEALWQGLADGTIDAIVSDHHPLDEESKKLEFDLADFGIIGLETAFAVVNTHKGSLPLEVLIDKCTTQPRRILQLPAVILAEGQAANLTVFDPDLEWTFTERDIRSKSRNTPFVGHTFRGKALGVVNNGRVVL